MDRRKFLKQSSLASSLFFVPSFVRAFEEVASSKLGYKRLVIIQLSGGNDGLNTVIPYRNDVYYKARPTLGIPQKDIIKLNDEVGLNSSLKPLKRLYDKGYLSIINNVGYPNPIRSHFRSMDIWQTATDANTYSQSGWIGRYLDHYGKQPHSAIEVDESLSLAMKGEQFNAIATQDAKAFYNLSKDPYFKNIHKHKNDAHLSEHNLGYLYKSMIAAESSAKYIFETSKTVTSKKEYPNNKFGKQMKTTAQFINSRIETKVFYTSLGGFDTHVNQLNTQKRLLSNYAESVEAFVEDLKDNNTFKDTLILTFSEFGRRVKQNASIGTDHGTANNVFIIGENLKKQGLYNTMASLSDLDDNGDLKFEIDFRTIYATVLDKWLEVDNKKVLNTSFNPLDFI
ncbi:DUF1501 domain-containing protein [Algibacter amylolyticus]|uniref:DUF1501 domain-containing protein n=1 Tax=Algibacter amylolyticus TaxID=1608400 RepID=A0A5M7BGK7_9FLAO|nr:DUF1501 domain-containing protein [Algibacter amylolyticus]KAA5827567.1 DUF1501 domain-containing protein [Algibacter amylolyticus]MBB5266773.1 uncharacterized protein (DUF1501 family) [Algibacter amylolyticus]TSJ81812.1 DUF1501 domain-containing protein [Algibacter amylolyticus]